MWLRVATTGLRERREAGRASGVCGVVGLRPRRGPPRRGALPQLHHRPPLLPLSPRLMRASCRGRLASKRVRGRVGWGGGSRGGGWASFSEFLGWVWVHREHGGVRVDCARDGSVVRDPLSRAQLLLTMIGCVLLYQRSLVCAGGCVCGGVRHGPVRRLSLSCVSRRRCGLSALHESFLRSAM